MQQYVVIFSFSVKIKKNGSVVPDVQRGTRQWENTRHRVLRYVFWHGAKLCLHTATWIYID